MGWDANVHKPGKCICPKCVKHREIRAASAPIEVDPNRRPVVHKAPITITAPKEVAVEIKKLTPEQKSELRKAIEENFNEELGRWGDGFSDHIVSELLGIPRVLVQEFRDNFYGELKQDPEITALRDQLDQAKKVLTNLQSTLGKMELKFADIAKRVGL